MSNSNNDSNKVNGTAAIIQNMISSINNHSNKDAGFSSQLPLKQQQTLQLLIKNSPSATTNSNLSNTVATLINNSQKRNILDNNNNGFASVQKAIKITPQLVTTPTNSEVQFKKNKITQNDDILVDSKALLTSSSIDSDNSSHSKASMDDNNFDSSRKANDSSEKKKEK